MRCRSAHGGLARKRWIALLLRYGWRLKPTEERMRQPRPDMPRLEALLDQRDHLKVQISILVDAAKPDQAKLKSLRRALSDLEKQIETYKQTY